MTAARDVTARAMLESELQSNVIALCRLLGYPVFHPLQSCGMQAGFPDLCIVGKTRILFRELKTETGTLKPEQRETGTAIRAAGGDWAVWRPRQWISHEIANELSLFGGTPALPFEAAWDETTLAARLAELARLRIQLGQHYDS